MESERKAVACQEAERLALAEKEEWKSRAQSLEEENATLKREMAQLRSQSKQPCKRSLPTATRIRRSPSPQHVAPKLPRLRDTPATISKPSRSPAPGAGEGEPLPAGPESGPGARGQQSNNWGVLVYFLALVVIVFMK